MPFEGAADTQSLLPISWNKNNISKLEPPTLGPHRASLPGPLTLSPGTWALSSPSSQVCPKPKLFTPLGGIEWNYGTEPNTEWSQSCVIMARPGVLGGQGGSWAWRIPVQKQANQCPR